MQLYDRYLAAIRRNLPPAKADDIVAELRDDLLSRAEAREEALGRPLEKAEQEALVKEFGRPMLVAARYLDHQHLIGPELFPYYRTVMKLVLSIQLIVLAVLAGVDIALGSGRLWQAVPQMLGQFLSAAITAFAIVTLIFAAIERHGGRRRIEEWEVGDLPSIEDLARKDSRRDAPFEIVVGALFLLWWIGAIPFPPQGWDKFVLVPAPVWAQLHLPIALLLGARLVMSVLSLMPSRLPGLRQALNLGTILAGLAILYLLYQPGHWVDVLPGTAGGEQVAKLEYSINLSVRVTIAVCAVVWTLGAIGGAWKWWRRRGSPAD
ncbi:hypothetical protein ACFQ1E_03765 [Sphingomonas canadensis]|uniref:Uncharacterized protein n=1 Tax=Sphingomonas canadensis TaxID=1219257 RepID=A0ABW3H525_9SPHN|nr:hypothetical protein [Sphingomonas canadensis]MCW3834640.1 hypothetical protein [Sphingomonas canadensis]